MAHPLVRIVCLALLVACLQAAPVGADDTFSTSPVTAPDTNVAPDGLPQLLSVTLGNFDGFDQVVFEFDKHVPGYTVNLVDQVTQDGSGEPVALAGSAFIQVAFSVVASGQVGAPPAPQGRQTPGFPQLREVVGAGDFEGVVSFGLGLAQPGGFRVNALTEPDRVVIDVEATLPRTGSSAEPMAIGGVVVLLLGIGLLDLSRRRSTAVKGRR